MNNTRIRDRVVAFAVALAAVTYLDRVCISILAPRIMADLELSPVEMSYVFSAFTLAYGIFEIPTAWWADRVGSRRVLTRIVVWWSVFTMVTGAAFNYVSLLIARVLFGVGEAGAWPNAARVFSRWVPSHERGRVQGVFFAGAHLSGGLTPGLVAYAAQMMHWRVVFVLCGFVGLAWAAAWYRWFRDEPRDHPQVSPEEARYIESTRGIPAEHAEGGWAEAFRAPGMIPLCIQYFSNGYGFYFFITWLPTYLAKQHGMASGELALFAGLPLLFSVLADLSGGWTTDSLSRRLGPRLARSGIGTTAYAFAAVAMYVGTLSPEPRVAGFLIAVAGAASMFTLAPAWATAIDAGGRNAATAGAIMNTAGQVGGFLSPIVVGYSVKWYGDWNLPLRILAATYVMAAVAWLVMRQKNTAPRD